MKPRPDTVIPSRALRRTKRTLMGLRTATGMTFMTKFAVASSFLAPVLLLELEEAVWVSVAWGIALVAALSWYVAGRQMANRIGVLAEHVGVALLVVTVSALVGRWVSTTFA